MYSMNVPFEKRQYCRKFATLLPSVSHIYGRTTWKMEQNKKTSGIPFTLEKLRETADVIKR
jgi:hypothetical protein